MAASRRMEFPGQGSDPCHSCVIHHSCDNTESFNLLCWGRDWTCVLAAAEVCPSGCATVGTPLNLLFFAHAKVSAGPRGLPWELIYHAKAKCFTSMSIEMAQITAAREKVLEGFIKCFCPEAFNLAKVCHHTKWQMEERYAETWKYLWAQPVSNSAFLSKIYKILCW